MNNHRIEEFLRNLHILTVAVRRVLEERYLQETSPEPLSFSRYNLLKLIQHKGVQFVGDIARFLGVSYPAASRTVDKLVRTGFLSRTEDPDDRRAARLTITKKGEKIIQTYERHKQGKIGKFLQQLPDQEIDDFNEYMERFYTHLVHEEQISDQLCLQCGAYRPSRCSIEPVAGSCAYNKGRVKVGKSRSTAKEGQSEGRR